MAIKITEKGIENVPSLRSFIGKEVNFSIKEITEKLHYNEVTDCIGIKGYRNITLIRIGQRIDIICKTDSSEEVINESLAPHEAEWTIIDIFEYVERPKPTKGFY